MIQIRDGLVPMLTSLGGISVRISPDSGLWRYSVIAVDARGNISPF
jgi:hypothetical protein